MGLSIVIVALVVGGILLLCRGDSPRRSAVVLPPDDQPPPAARLPLPSGRRLRAYVGEGLREIDAYLERRCGGV